jgi:hypothetical protein
METGAKTKQIIDVAENLLTAGISVVPLHGKIPIAGTKLEGGLFEKPYEGDEIPATFKHATGIGAICGKVSEGLECIDFDSKVPHIADTYNEYITNPDVKKIIDRGCMYAQKTLSGGFHLVYRYESDQYEGALELAFEPDPEGGKDKKIIETRGEGGYFVISPSPGYSPLFGDAENIGTISKEERDFLIEYARSFDKSTDKKSEHKALKIARKMIQNAKDGSKRIELYKASKLVGGYIGSGEITNEDKAIGILEEEIQQRDIDSFEVAQKTIIAGIEAGKLEPLASDMYIRVGVDYFKKITKPDRFGINRVELKRWKKEEILTDHGKEYIKSIPKFDDFIIIPSNTDYQAIQNNFYNLYNEFQHKPEPGAWGWTKRVMHHVFGDQYELGLRYLQLLYMHPERMAPILVLVSEERETGKTTFLNWLNMIFGANMVIIGASDLTNDFNHQYATSNIIAVEETLIEKNITVEKLKALATGKFVSVNQKWVSQFKLPFFGKFILTSNNEDKFARIDDAEIRFFIRKLSKPAGEYVNHNIEADMVKEIPAFLAFLNTLPPIDFSVSRTGFTTAELDNENLRVVKEESRQGLYKDLQIYFADYFDQNEDKHEVYATPTDIKNEWFKHNSRIEPHYIKSVLKKEFKLEPLKLMKYAPLNGGGEFEGKLITKAGRPYKFERKTWKS